MDIHCYSHVLDGDEEDVDQEIEHNVLYEVAYNTFESYVNEGGPPKIELHEQIMCREGPRSCHFVGFSNFDHTYM